MAGWENGGWAHSAGLARPLDPSRDNKNSLDESPKRRTSTETLRAMGRIGLHPCPTQHECNVAFVANGGRLPCWASRWDDAYHLLLWSSAAVLTRSKGDHKRFIPR